VIARACAIAAVAWVGAARADAPKLVALAADVALGPHGEVYASDAKTGAWPRRGATTIAGDVIGAARGLAVTGDGAVFRLVRDEWTVVYLGPHAKAIFGAGPRPVAAVGRAVYALDSAAPHKLADAPDPVIALAASPTGVVIETEHALLRLAGSTWKPIKGAPPHVAALLSDRFALADHGAGVVELATGKVVAWPGPGAIAAAIAVDDTVFAASVSHGTDARGYELFTVRAGHVAREPLATGPTSAVVAIAADRGGDAARVVVATREGNLFVRSRGTWSSSAIRDETPPPHPGPPPARSR